MSHRRTPEQILASARAMDRARAAGLPDEFLAVHIAVTAARRGKAPWPPAQHLAAYLADPRTRDMDEIQWQAVRQHLGG